ncbi:hypothetical protein PG994_009510 [Apiospora phragmitis]|uniref:Uncharacterized protein n=1 Tax=Apiospora phragmitis TaxID=2905665 RepID=A0ABR1U6D6_9PEZI
MVFILKIHCLSFPFFAEPVQPAPYDHVEALSPTDLHICQDTLATANVKNLESKQELLCMADQVEFEVSIQGQLQWDH